MNKPLIALLLLFSSAMAVEFSYSQALICSNEGGFNSYCMPAMATETIYADQFRCINLENGYEICLMDNETYFCIDTANGEKECIKL